MPSDISHIQKTGISKLIQRVKCFFDFHEIQIQFTIPTDKKLCRQLSCVTCHHCGGKWASCLEEGEKIPFWMVYSAKDEVEMIQINEENGMA